ncbi:MAG TPA: phosphate ABC transporter permease subunit PstC [Mariprofundaceae bacterium]|nr:phosphate ABC transporter permease subunit PstC [Mariprofundaceae bacterium]
MSVTKESMMEGKLEPTTAEQPKPARGYSDQIFKGITFSFSVALALLFLSILTVLWIESQPAIDKFGFGFLTSAEWNPVTEKFGALIAIVGTLVSTLIAMLIAIPLSIGIALYLSEIAPYWLRTPVGTAIELLAAIPSIVYGMWGLFVIAPLMSDHIQPWLHDYFGFLPFFSGPAMGIGMLTAGLVLALMIIPFISSVTRDVFLMTPQPLKEAAYGLGCTTWEVVRDVVIPYGKKGVVGAVFLGLGRALGETMAVTFVIGNAYHLSWSLFAPGNSIASTLANEFTEADGDLYLSSLIELGLVLFMITFIILGAAQLWLRSAKQQQGS